MDPHNIDRRDSKKSNKNGNGGGGGSKNSNRCPGNLGGGGGNVGGGVGNGGGSGKSSGDKLRSHSQKSGQKSYREREIYKPPSMRSNKSRNSNSYSEQDNKVKQQQNVEDKNNPNQSHSKKSPFSKNGNGGNGGNSSSGSSPSSHHQQNGNYGGGDYGIETQNGYSLFGNGNGSGGGGNSGNGSSVPSSPLVSNRMQQHQQNAFNIGLAKRMLNVNAKEFQFLPIHQQQHHQQISNFLSQFDPSLFYNGNGNSPILASSGCYPLKQSKSSGNMNLLLQQQQQQQAAALEQLQNAMNFGFPFSSGAGSANGGGGNSSSQFNRLSQSKSSGNVPGNAGNKPRVRFDDEEPEFDDVDVDDFIAGQLGNYLASLKLNGDVSGLSSGSQFSQGYPSFQPHQQQSQPNKVNNIPVSPQPVLKSSLQKSRTGFYLNLYGNQQPQPQQMNNAASSSSKSIYGFNSNNFPSANLHHHQQQHHPGSNYAPTKVATTTSGLIGQQYPHHQQFSNLSAVGSSHVVKRSRSFGPGTHHLPKVSATMLLSASTHGLTTSHSIYSDFCITKWPRSVQELVTAAVTGVDRIPARNWIEMVNGIFDAMLCDYRPTKKESRSVFNSQSVGITSPAGSASSFGKSLGDKKMSSEASIPAVELKSSGVFGCQENGDGNNDLGLSPDAEKDNEEEDDDEDEDEDDDTDLTSAAVYIFLYFIQREKDRTVMESLLNTCFASFQRLSSSSSSSSSSTTKSNKQQRTIMAQQIGKPSISRQWSNFLRFLSTLYSQVKLIRRQKQNQQQPGQSMDEMSFSLLALLCDSCLATLRSPQSYTAEMMGCLFTVLTSIGRDMEGTFPLKMKQLLAAVRDALLGIGPYQQHHYANNSSTISGAQSFSTSSSSSSSSALSSRSSSGLSPIVQKTLMQLIELHAANWQLPASAVRYYYSSGGSGNKNSRPTATSSSSSSISSGNPSVNNMTKKINNQNNEKQNNNPTISPNTVAENAPSSQKLTSSIANPKESSGEIPMSKMDVGKCSEVKEEILSTAATISTVSSIRNESEEVEDKQLANSSGTNASILAEDNKNTSSSAPQTT